MHIYIDGVEQLGSPFSIPAGSRVTPRWIGTVGGPVHVVSDIPVFTSERVFTVPNDSFNEMMGYPANQLVSEYWFPWYELDQHGEQHLDEPAVTQAAEHADRHAARITVRAASVLVGVIPPISCEISRCRAGHGRRSEPLRALTSPPNWVKFRELILR